MHTRLCFYFALPFSCSYSVCICHVVMSYLSFLSVFLFLVLDMQFMRIKMYIMSSLSAKLCMQDYWHCSHSMLSRLYETVERPSVRPFHHSAATRRCGGFAALCPYIYISIDCCTAGARQQRRALSRCQRNWTQTCLKRFGAVVFAVPRTALFITNDRCQCHLSASSKQQTSRLFCGRLSWLMSAFERTLK